MLRIRNNDDSNNLVYPYQTGCHNGLIELRIFVPLRHFDGVLLLSLNNSNNNNNGNKYDFISKKSYL